MMHPVQFGLGLAGRREAHTRHRRPRAEAPREGAAPTPGVGLDPPAPPVPGARAGPEGRTAGSKKSVTSYSDVAHERVSARAYASCNAGSMFAPTFPACAIHPGACLPTCAPPPSGLTPAGGRTTTCPEQAEGEAELRQLIAQAGAIWPVQCRRRTADRAGRPSTPQASATRPQVKAMIEACFRSGDYREARGLRRRSGRLRSPGTQLPFTAGPARPDMRACHSPLPRRRRDRQQREPAPGFR